MTKIEAKDEAKTLITKAASRSKVCSFINKLASKKLITEQQANTYADMLVDGGSMMAIPILERLIGVLDS